MPTTGSPYRENIIETLQLLIKNNFIRVGLAPNSFKQKWLAVDCKMMSSWF
jgi:hypothetical protein